MESELLITSGASLLSMACATSRGTVTARARLRTRFGGDILQGQIEKARRFDDEVEFEGRGGGCCSHKREEVVWGLGIVEEHRQHSLARCAELYIETRSEDPPSEVVPERNQGIGDHGHGN